MKIAKKISVLLLVFALSLGTAFQAAAETGPGENSAQTVPVKWNNMRLDASGVIGFEMQLPLDSRTHVPQYYEVQVYVKTTGDYVLNRTKKYKTSSLRVNEEITFNKVGLYRFTVTCHFVGGDVSTTSDFDTCPECVVTENYLSRQDDGNGPGYGPGGTQNPAGPGGPAAGVPSASGKSAWYQNPATNKWYYAATTGTWLKNTWYFINNYWYYFDSDCSMHTGWLDQGGYWYYLHPVEAPQGHRAAGFAKIDGKWYYFDPGTGRMLTGVIAVGGYIYCMDASGAMLMNEGTPDGHYYNAEGHRIR